MQLPMTAKSIVQHLTLPALFCLATALNAGAPTAWVLLIARTDGTTITNWIFEDHAECRANAAIQRTLPGVKSAHCAPVK